MALSSSQQRLMEMGRAGAERVAREHDVAIEAAKLVKLFARALVSLRGGTFSRACS